MEVGICTYEGVGKGVGGGRRADGEGEGRLPPQACGCRSEGSDQQSSGSSSKFATSDLSESPVTPATSLWPSTGFKSMTSPTGSDTRRRRAGWTAPVLVRRRTRGGSRGRISDVRTSLNTADRARTYAAAVLRLVGLLGSRSPLAGAPTSTLTAPGAEPLFGVVHGDVEPTCQLAPLSPGCTFPAHLPRQLR